MTRAAELRLSDFKVQNLSNTAWAFALARLQNAQLFAALARTAELRLADFKVQGLTNIAWVFATVAMASQSDGTPDQLDVQLFAMLARAAKRRLDDFTVLGNEAAFFWHP